MNSTTYSQSLDTLSLTVKHPLPSPSVTSLKIRNVGHVPAYKNSKQRTRRGLITKPEYQKIMVQIIVDLELQLHSAFLIAGGETVTGLSLQSWIAWLLPHDDSLSWIPMGSWQVEYVRPGQEGADITITEIT